MSAAGKIFKGLKRVHYGFYTRKEFLLKCIDKLTAILGRPTDFHRRSFLTKFRNSNIYRLKDAVLPVPDKSEENGMRVSNIIDMDIFSSYLYCNDVYDEKTFDELEAILPEGLYGLVNDTVNVTVEAGDIVIDAGSCCGSFSAYASVKGAESVYAFEPVSENFAYLLKTAKLNKNIIPIQKGLSDENTAMNIFVDPGHFSGSSFIMKPNIAPSQAETVRLDDFVRENNIQRVDFIKADIEGFERHMLAGAQETLRTFAPKLALCTYHLPDDPQVMAELILKANPKYNIVQKRCKLFASVPE